jgi:glycosyltransferase involved in cell wall biosynthesis
LPGHTEAALHEGVEYRRVPIRPDRVLVKLLRKTAWMRPARRPYLVSRFYYASYARHVAEDVKRLGADVVHVPNFPQFLPILRAKNPAIRIVLHMHCNWLCDFQPRMLERRLRDADLITTCSDYVTEQVKQVFPQYAARCRTMYNGVDGRGFERPASAAPPAPPALDQGGARLLYVGRVSPEKGVHVLLEAFTRVLEKVPQATLTVVGPDEVQPPDIYIRFSQDPKVRALRRFYDGHNYGQRLKQALPPAVAARVNFVGAAPHAKLPGYFAEADLFLFPSVWQEPFGISVIEAQAAGVPVVATRSGGVVESIVHGETGLLVERADAREMADAALLLLADAPLRAKLAGAARESVRRRFSWQHVRDGVLREYLAIQPREPAAAMKQGRAWQWGDRVNS